VKKEQIQSSSGRIILRMITVLFLVFLLQGKLACQNEEFAVMFYNVENLFDTIDSPLDDDEFLPGGPRYWGSWRYYSKLNSIYKVIVSANEWMLPQIIGLCEVENQAVVEDLVRSTYLSRHAYRAVYAGGKDERGIGVALLVDTSFFRIKEMKISFPLNGDGSYIATRPVLSARLINTDDSLTVFVTHWPSRRGGATATEGLREMVAVHIDKEVRAARYSFGVGEKIIIMGDLNCEPESEIVTGALRASLHNGIIADTLLYNLSLFGGTENHGSYKYQGLWLIYDQIIVSGSLLEAVGGYRVNNSGLSVFSDNMILVPDTRYNGLKPFSTWTGPVYNGGYSDHLPVTARFELVNSYPAKE